VTGAGSGRATRTGSGRATRTGSGPRRSGRRAGDSGTREAILAAARAEFAAHGYDAATIRAIAARAGVDPALVHHYFGTKERLFAAAVSLPVVPGEVIAAVLAGTGQDGTGLGERMIRAALGVWENTDVQATFLGLLRSALTSEQAAVMLREFVTQTILVPLSAAAPASEPGQAEFRAGLVGSQVLGLALTRYVLRLPPVAAATPDRLAAAIGPTLERYLAGDIQSGAGQGREAQR
jgi:AcrR family transcriptional regulator